MTDLRPVEDTSAETEPRSNVERWVMPYFEDSSLWPVLLVVLAHIAAFMTPLVLMAVRDRTVPGIVCGLILAYFTFVSLRWEWRHRGRLGALAFGVGLVWLMAGLAAYYSDQIGIM